jgi:hypothetical protein
MIFNKIIIVNMEIFFIIAGVASCISLVISSVSLFLLKSVYKITINKSGNNNVSRNSGVNFTKNRASKPLYLKRLALELYLEGLGFRSIGRILKVSHVSIYNWNPKFGQKAKELRKNDEISVVEIDEMHTYIGSKKTQLGYRLLMLKWNNELSILG